MEFLSPEPDCDLLHLNYTQSCTSVLQSTKSKKTQNQNFCLVTVLNWFWAGTWEFHCILNRRLQIVAAPTRRKILKLPCQQ